MRPVDQSRPPWPLIHSSCSLSRKRVASAGVLYVWFLQGVVDRRREAEELRDVAAGARGSARRARGRPGRRRRSTGRRRRRRTSAGRSSRRRSRRCRPGRPPAPDVASTRTSAPSSAPATRLIGAATPVEVSLWVKAYTSTPASACRLRVGARVGGDDGRLGEPGGELGGLGELRGELAEGQVLATCSRSGRASRCPRRRWSRRCRGSPRSPRGAENRSRMPSRTCADQVLDRGLAVGGAEEGGAGGGQGVQRLRPHLGGARAETAVGGLDVSGNLDLSHERERSRSAERG